VDSKELSNTFGIPRPISYVARKESKKLTSMPEVSYI
jgi:hypothetical protein